LRRSTRSSACSASSAPGRTAPAPGAAGEGLPYIAAFSGSQELRSGALPWIYNLRAGHLDEIDYIARHTRQIGIRRVSLLSEYNSQGWELRDALISSFESRGDSVASISSVDHEGQQVQPARAPSLGARGRPQAILLGADYVASARFVEAVRQAGLHRAVLHAVDRRRHALMDMLGAQAAGLSVTQVVPFPGPRRRRSAVTSRPSARATRSRRRSPAWKPTWVPACSSTRCAACAT
jgi:ABC-type branched-subunit amino acid transport system substrate-binding protein